MIRIRCQPRLIVAGHAQPIGVSVCLCKGFGSDDMYCLGGFTKRCGRIQDMHINVHNTHVPPSVRVAMMHMQMHAPVFGAHTRKAGAILAKLVLFLQS